MRSLSLLLVLLLSLLTLSASWRLFERNDPFRRDLLPRATQTGEGEPIVGDETPQSTTAQPTKTTAEKTSKETTSDKSDSKSDSKGSKTTDDDKKTTDAPKSTGKAKSSSKKSTKIPSTAQVGSISMVTPAPTAGFTLFKIGDPVTFVWNYTDLIVSPTAINIEAYCSDGANYFTITGNASADITKAVWDTGEYQSTATVKLPVATYSLYIYDAAHVRTEVASAGYLQPYNQYTFGMYTPKPAVSLKDFTCPTCSGANSLIDPGTLRFLIVMGMLTALSFAWFIAGVL